MPFDKLGSLGKYERATSMPIAAALLTFGTVFPMLGIEYLSTMSARTRLNWPPAPSEIGLLTNLGKWYFRTTNIFCIAGSVYQPFFTQHGTVVFEASFNTLTGIPPEALAKLSRLGEFGLRFRVQSQLLGSLSISNIIFLRGSSSNRQ